MTSRPTKRRLLVTGASGFLGWHICRCASETWDVTGTVLSQDISQKGIRIWKLDLTDFKRLKQAFGVIRPDAVVHTAAMSDTGLCLADPVFSNRINRDVPINLAGLCSDRRIPFVFTSSDLVFDGLRPPYGESDPPNPISLYGEQKVSAGEDIARAYPEAVVARMPLMFGLSGPWAKSPFQSMLSAVKAGKPVNLFVDEFRTPASGRSAAAGLLMALDRTDGGLLHLGGRERISRFEFGRLAARVFGLDHAPLKPCSQKDVDLAVPRPPDVSLDSRKAFDAGYNPLSLTEELEAIYDEIVKRFHERSATHDLE